MSEQLPIELFRLLSKQEREDYFAQGGVEPLPVGTRERSEWESSTNQPEEREWVKNPDYDKATYDIEFPTKEDVRIGPAPTQSSNFDDMGFDFESPFELLVFLDDNISSGRIIPYPWQKQILEDFAHPEWNDQLRYQAIVRAANGSGKDKYVIAPCVMWLLLRYRKSLAVVTSSSGAQLDNQTCRYIDNLCSAANKKLHPKLCRYVYRKYEIDFGEGVLSQGFCYATDEPGKAEGYHPTDFGCKMGIFVSEDKSVPDEINIALNKCTGYSHRMHVSTPGIPSGHFYDYSSSATPRNYYKNIVEKDPSEWVEYHVPATACPRNLYDDYMQQMADELPGGIHGAAYKSQVGAEFSTTDEMVVCTGVHVQNAMNNIITPHSPEPCNQGGLDLSDGGDETCFSVRNGNKHLVTEPFKFSDTQDTIDFLQPLFYKWGMDQEGAYINGDAGGLGKPILDSLRRLGWNIRYYYNNGKSPQPKIYTNLGTALWFNFRKLLEKYQVILLKEKKLRQQLCTRYYKLLNKNTHQLLSKPEQKARGYPSPDRADSLILCYANYKPNFAYIDDPDVKKATIKDRQEVTQNVEVFTQREWSARHSDKFRIDNKQKNFSYLQSEVEEHNRKIRSLLETK